MNKIISICVDLEGALYGIQSLSSQDYETEEIFLKEVHSLFEKVVRKYIDSDISKDCIITGIQNGYYESKPFGKDTVYIKESNPLV